MVGLIGPTESASMEPQPGSWGDRHYALVGVGVDVAASMEPQPGSWGDERGAGLPVARSPTLASMEPQPGSWGDVPHLAHVTRGSDAGFNGAPARKLGRLDAGHRHLPRPPGPASMEPQPGSWGDRVPALGRGAGWWRFNGAPARKLGRRRGLAAAEGLPVRRFNGAPARKLGRPRRGGGRWRRSSTLQWSPSPEAGETSSARAAPDTGPSVLQWSPSPEAGETGLPLARRLPPGVAGFNGSPARKLGRQARTSGNPGATTMLQWSPSPEAGETPVLDRGYPRRRTHGFNGAPARKLGRQRGQRPWISTDATSFNGAPARKLGRPSDHTVRTPSGPSRLQWSPSPEAGETSLWPWRTSCRVP